jgi:hypothetical protein
MQAMFDYSVTSSGSWVVIKAKFKPSRIDCDFLVSSGKICWNFKLRDLLYYKKAFQKKEWHFYAPRHKNANFIGCDQVVVDIVSLLINPLSEMGISCYKCEVECKGSNLRAFLPHPKSLLNLPKGDRERYSKWLGSFGSEEM